MDVVKEDVKLIGVEAEDAKNRVTLILGRPLRRPAESWKTAAPNVHNLIKSISRAQAKFDV